MKPATSEITKKRTIQLNFQPARVTFRGGYVIAIDRIKLSFGRAGSAEDNIRSQKLSRKRIGETRANPSDTVTCLEAGCPAPTILRLYRPSRFATTRHTTSLSFSMWTGGADMANSGGSCSAN